jgi:hypothetical protein
LFIVGSLDCNRLNHLAQDAQTNGELEKLETRNMKPGAKSGALRVKIDRGADTETWVLYGSLAGDMVDELVQCWKSKRNERNGRKCVVDLVELTLVDERGELALMEMMLDGAHFVARGVYITNVLETLSRRSSRRRKQCGS